MLWMFTTMTLVLFIGAALGVRFLRFGDDDNSGGPSPSLDIEAILSLIEAFANMSYDDMSYWLKCQRIRIDYW